MCVVTAGRDLSVTLFAVLLSSHIKQNTWEELTAATVVHKLQYLW